MKAHLLVLWMLILGAPSYAEFRIWTGANGATLEAELVRRMGTEVLLKSHKGNTIKIPFEKLSAADRKYIELANPPTLELRVITNLDRSNKDRSKSRRQIQTEVFQFEIEIKKQSQPLYPHALKVDLVVVGIERSTKEYVILQQISRSFSFTGTSRRIAFVAPQKRLESVDISRKYGVEYLGYLAIVTDSQGNQLDIASNRKTFEVHATQLIGTQSGVTLDKEFKPKAKKVKKKKRK